MPMNMTIVIMKVLFIKAHCWIFFLSVRASVIFAKKK